MSEWLFKGIGVSSLSNSLLWQYTILHGQIFFFFFNSEHSPAGLSGNGVC